MNDKEELIKVGKYNLEFNDILGINIDELEIFRSKGLPSHMVKRKHFKCLKYIKEIKKYKDNALEKRKVIMENVKISNEEIYKLFDL